MFRIFEGFPKITVSIFGDRDGGVGEVDFFAHRPGPDREKDRELY